MFVLLRWFKRQKLLKLDHLHPILWVWEGLVVVLRRGCERLLEFEIYNLWSWVEIAMIFEVRWGFDYGDQKIKKVRSWAWVKVYMVCVLELSFEWIFNHRGILFKIATTLLVKELFNSFRPHFLFSTGFFDIKMSF